MQTFLPYESFQASAASLDRQRLGKQRVENLQIMKALLGLSKGWSNHPAVRMWRGHEDWLMEYQRAVCNEWTSRGYKDTCLEKTQALTPDVKSDYPVWLGREDFHRSHRMNLMRKDPEFYLFPDAGDPQTTEYVWPV